ncbi:MAG: HD-GYP domain-containing protein, partial [Burkholderiales bacterium]
TGIYMIEGARFSYVNPRLCEILGYSAEALLQMGPHDVTLEEDRALVDTQLRRRQAGELAAARYEFRVRRPSGEIRHVGVHGSVAEIDGRRVIIGVLQDITARVQAELLANTQIARLGNAMRGTVGAVSRMVELRDPYTAGHESRVAALMREIGRTMDYAPDRREGLEVIGGLHDIGKIAVPAEILVKPSKLTGAEFDLIREHPLRGYEILAGLEFPWPAAQATLQHHERIDGSGYPHGLKGTDILPEARVLAVADTVEAMASHRPYRAGLGIDAALAEIERGRGSAYDADVADACLALFGEKGYRLPA